MDRKIGLLKPITTWNVTKIGYSVVNGSKGFYLNKIYKSTVRMSMIPKVETVILSHFAL